MQASEALIRFVDRRAESRVPSTPRSRPRFLWEIDPGLMEAILERARELGANILVGTPDDYTQEQYRIEFPDEEGEVILHRYECGILSYGEESGEVFAELIVPPASIHLVPLGWRFEFGFERVFFPYPAIPGIEGQIKRISGSLRPIYASERREADIRLLRALGAQISTTDPLGLEAPQDPFTGVRAADRHEVTATFPSFGSIIFSEIRSRDVLSAAHFTLTLARPAILTARDRPIAPLSLERAKCRTPEGERVSSVFGDVLLAALSP